MIHSNDIVKDIYVEAKEEHIARLIEEKHCVTLSFYVTENKNISRKARVSKSVESHNEMITELHQAYFRDFDLTKRYYRIVYAGDMLFFNLKLFAPIYKDIDKLVFYTSEKYIGKKTNTTVCFCRELFIDAKTFKLSDMLSIVHVFAKVKFVFILGPKIIIDQHLKETPSKISFPQAKFVIYTASDCSLDIEHYKYIVLPLRKNNQQILVPGI